MNTLLIMAGGTGGHVFPGLAVAEVLQNRGWKIVWLGGVGGMETQLVPKHNIPIETIQFGGVRGKGLLTKFFLPFKLIRACWQAWQVLKRVKPDAVLGMGGYIAFPAGVMTYLTGRTLILHEQNSVAGLTNKLLAKIARKVLVAFPNALAGKWTGNPIRQNLINVAPPEERFKNREGALRILVVGGSLGATALNTVVPQALALLPIENRPIVKHQSGKKNLSTLQDNYAHAGVEATIVDFIDDMATEYAHADLIICRAGAMTVAEISAVGAASLLVPFPLAVDDHQTANARFLVDNNAAFMRQQKELDAAWLAKWLASLTRETLLEMAIKAREQGKPDAASQVADVCQALIAKKG